MYRTLRKDKLGNHHNHNHNHNHNNIVNRNTIHNLQLPAMRTFVMALVGLLATVSSPAAVAAAASPPSSLFYADVIRRTQARKNQLRKQNEVNDALLAKAMPVKDYEQKYGVSLGSHGGNNNNNARQLEDYDNMDYDMYSFSGYSLTFAKCQPVQYFSDEAVEMGTYSPMITDDIVVLRLCPTNSCSESKEYGCYYNFAEYAIELQDYLNIMLRYADQKKEYMCEYCNDCIANGNNNNNNRRLEDNDNNNNNNEGDNNNGDENQEQDNGDGDNNNNEQENEQQEDEQEQEDYNNEQQEDEDQQEYNGEQEDAADYYDDADAAAGNDDAGDDFYLYACSGWDTYCSDYSTYCVDGEDDGNNENQYLDYVDYLDYLECTEVNVNGANYYIQPRCDGSHNTIKMVIHYDAYCMNAGGSGMSIKDLGLGMRDSTFQGFYSGECIDCSESNYPPYDATSTMCNMVHYKSAKCVSGLEYNPFENGGNDADDTTECAYIESIRTGTYDETGTITLRSFGFTSEEITPGQKALLCLFVAMTVGLTIYACYLHHAMTNLLIKSLSHRELLPPSRHASRRSSPRRSGRRLKKVGADSDWDADNEFA